MEAHQMGESRDTTTLFQHGCQNRLMSHMAKGEEI
jgi:hypothetical protein